MEGVDKYLGLTMLLIGSFLGFIVLGVGIFFLLRLFSATLIYIPGFEKIYGYVITIVPYAIFFATYVYLNKKRRSTKSKTSKIFAVLFLAMGFLICLTGFVLSSFQFFGVQKEWLVTFSDNSQYFLMAQLLMVFLIAAALALGDAKEKDWMEKNAEDRA